MTSFPRFSFQSKFACPETAEQRHLWRVSGSYSNVSVFDVADNAELHEIVSNLPLFPYMDIKVRPLCRYPSAIRPDDS
ncbi:MAG TPA: hypothetical protein DD728_15375 [Hyphomonas atlantica]|uniref:Muconolactone isomerase domain-containing protein n=1 Tax=Hyphomonas atlantica TaxID=1280948 RepID=A0A356W971_9PROT|nr:hypothetical protein [Hyphomonas atlantica]